MTNATEDSARGAAEENSGTPETPTEERANQRPPSEPDPERTESAEPDQPSH